MLEKKAYLHAIACTTSLGAKKFKQLELICRDDWQWAWDKKTRWVHLLVAKDQREESLKKMEGFAVSAEYDALEKSGITMVHQREKDYPSLLNQIYDPPYFLYQRGKAMPRQLCYITVVGSRKIEPYSQHCLEYLLQGLKQYPLGIISGLAFGVDAYAHRVALANKLYTAAVLGSGVSYITPKSHTALAKEIVQAGGTIISEFPPTTPGYAYHFPRRNRILAGLSEITLVIQANHKSGSLITAKFCLDYNREVATIPAGILGSSYEGNHQLLKDGALLINTPEDIIRALGLEKMPLASTQLTLNEQTILSALTEKGFASIDLLRATTAISSGEILSLLSLLEMKQLISYKPGLGYSLKPVL